MFPTDEQILEELRQLNLADGDETKEHADTQYSDWPPSVPLTLPGDMNSDDAIYWIDRCKEIFPGEDVRIQIG